MGQPITVRRLGAEPVKLQDDILAELHKYGVNAVDNTTTTNVTYVGKERDIGTWVIQKVDQTGSFPAITYATITNNPTMTSYTTAWTNRVTLTYGNYSVAF